MYDARILIVRMVALRVNCPYLLTSRNQMPYIFLFDFLFLHDRDSLSDLTSSIVPSLISLNQLLHDIGLPVSLR